MNDDPKCPACVQIGLNLPMLPPPHTCRPGCVRAAGTEGGAQSRHVPYRPVSFAERAHVVAEFAGREPERHMANYIVRARSEIVRLRAENERMEDAGRHHASELRLAVLAERARHHSEITHIRAEVERLTKERNKALAVAVVLNETDTLVDRHARDIAVVKAALEAAAGSAKTIILAHPIGVGLRGMSAVVSDRDGAIADKVETSIRDLDPEAVLKGMEDGR
jgi:hypothetical protein